MVCLLMAEHTTTYKMSLLPIPLTPSYLTTNLQQTHLNTLNNTNQPNPDYEKIQDNNPVSTINKLYSMRERERMREKKQASASVSA